MSYKKETFYQVYSIIFGALTLAISGLFLINILYYLILANFDLEARQVVTNTLKPQGKFVEVNGYQMHIYCTGEGDETTILEADEKNWSVYWTAIQNEVSKYSRVCSYDRLGRGWSQGQAESSEGAIETLHDLLQVAEITGPYILAGHSWGAENVLAFAEKYPTETKALILYEYPFVKEEALMNKYKNDELNFPLVMVSSVIRDLPVRAEQEALDAVRTDMNMKLEEWQEDSTYVIIDGSDRNKTFRAISSAIVVLDEL